MSGSGSVPDEGGQALERTQKLMKLRFDMETLIARVEPYFENRLTSAGYRLKRSGWSADLQAKVVLDECDEDDCQKQSTVTLVHFPDCATMQDALRQVADFLDSEESASFASPAVTAQ